MVGDIYIRTGDIQVNPEIGWIQKTKESPLAKQNPERPKMTMDDANKSLAEKYQVDEILYCPITGGRWENGERGNGHWVPDCETIPGKSNPEKLPWNEILKLYDIKDIQFKDGYPDFSEISRSDVEISPFTDSRDDNFDLADIQTAEQKNCTPEEVRQWRKENKYTWHECQDMKTMQKVPSIVHNNVSHSGGISAVKNLAEV